MAIRIIEDDVRAIMPSSLENSEIEVFIKVANQIVDAQLLSSGLTDDELFEIERWMSAHLIALTRERMGKTERIGDAAITYAGDAGEGLLETQYGKMVAMLDTTGTLANMGKKSISMKAIKSFDS